MYIQKNPEFTKDVYIDTLVSDQIVAEIPTIQYTLL